MLNKIEVQKDERLKTLSLTFILGNLIQSIINMNKLLSKMIQNQCFYFLTRKTEVGFAFGYNYEDFKSFW